MSKFLSDTIKNLKKTNPYIGLAEEGVLGDITDYIDTGSYAVNALVSGSIYGGLPGNRITMLAGESTTGKTYFLLTIFAKFLQNNKDSVGVLFETESAISKKMIEDFGMDPQRILIVPVSTIQEFRHQALVIIDNYEKKRGSEEGCPKIIMGLDSLGMLSTTKEVDDMSSGSETRDMTRAQLLRGSFRVLTLKLAKAAIPMVVTNHVYDTMGMYSAKQISGGQGPYLASSIILQLSKKKETQQGKVVGNIVHVRAKKSRMTVEEEKVDAYINFRDGLSRWYGMITFAVAAGIFEKSGSYIVTPDGSKTYAKNIMKNPDKYFNSDVLEKIEKYVASRFKYGSDKEGV